MAPDKNRYILMEEIHQIEIHKWIESEKSRCDLGEAACIDWVARYAKQFRSWADSLPFHCIHCGVCKGDSSECHSPFNFSRIEHISRNNLKIGPK